MIRRFLAALRAFATSGRLEPGDPHPYAADYHWPGSCWCGLDRLSPVHHRGLGETPVSLEALRTSPPVPRPRGEAA